MKNVTSYCLSSDSMMFHCINRPMHRAKHTIQNLFFLALLLSTGIEQLHAQCKNFVNADVANPILNATPMPENITGLQFLDIDNDGDLDCYLISDNKVFKLYRNTGTPKRAEYVLCTQTGFESISLPNPVSPFAFADLDGDGDYDCIVQQLVITGTRSNYYTIRYLQNIGTPQQPLFADADGSRIFSGVDTHPGFGYSYFTFSDIDGDGDKDFYYTQSGLSGSFGYTFLNTGATPAPVFKSDSVNTYFGYNYRSYYDFNKDGLPDAVDNDGGVGYHYLLNRGSLLSGPFYLPLSFTPDPPQFSDIAPYTFVDLNGDGAPEAFNYSGHYTTVAPVAAIRKTEQNIGNRNFTKLTSTQKSDAYSYKWEYNGKLIPSYHKPFIYALKQGEYILYISDSCGTGVSLPYRKVDSNLTTANVGDLSIAGHLPVAATIAVQAYPNPFTQSILLELPQKEVVTTRTIRITDIVGRQMMTQTTSAASIAIGSTLPKGIYLLQVWQNNTLICHTMIQKQ